MAGRGNSPQREKANSYSSLEGMVSNAQDKQRVEMISKSVPGLMSFTNNIRTDK